MENSILQIKDYGTIKIELRRLMDARGMKRNHLARLIHVRYEVVDKWYNGKVERIDADVLARLCYALDCEVSDLIVYQKTAAPGEAPPPL